MRLPTTMGFEMTGIVHNYRERHSDLWDSIEPTVNVQVRTLQISKIIGNTLARLYPSVFCGDGSYTDGHCLEFPSPVFSTTESMDKFYKVVSKQFKKHKVTPQKRAVTVCGGNHMHFGISLRVKRLRRIFRDFTNRYYISWVFTQPDDTASCDNIIACKELLGIRTCIIAGKIVPLEFSRKAELYKLIYTDSDSVKWDGMRNHKSIGLSLNRPSTDNDSYTLEFRCIEAPMDYSEFVDQRDFFIAYYKYAMKLKNVDMPQLVTGRALNKIRAEDAAMKFREFVMELGLDPVRYEKYVRRNLYPRWKLGRKRV